jgi:hypothetical protein
MTAYGYVKPHLLEIKKAWSHSHMSWENFQVLATKIADLLGWIGNQPGHPHENKIASFLYHNWHDYYIPRDVSDVWEQLDDMYGRLTDFDYKRYRDIEERPSKHTLSRLEWEQNADAEATKQYENQHGRAVEDDETMWWKG